jgi:hypothetical protein
MGSESYGTMIIKSSNRFVDVGEQDGPRQSDSKLWISRMTAILLLGAGVSANHIQQRINQYDMENITEKSSCRCKLPRKS